MIATTLGVIGTLLGVIRAWPQVLQIAVRRQTAGVSVQTWALTLLNNVSWLTLGVIIGAFPIVISNLLSAVGSIAVLTAVQLQQRQKRLARRAAVALAGAAVVGVTSLGGASALTVLATVLAVSMFMPQVVLVLRSGAAGVSAATWLVSALSAAVWLLYAFALGRPSPWTGPRSRRVRSSSCRHRSSSPIEPGGSRCPSGRTRPSMPPRKAGSPASPERSDCPPRHGGGPPRLTGTALRAHVTSTVRA